MTTGIDLPGFRFHPTEEELLDFYLRNMVLGKSSGLDVIGVRNIYCHDPLELPGLSTIVGEREWYFFVPRDRKHGGIGRPNRTTQTGYWKATGSDRRIVKLSDPKHVIGLRKTLVFYTGRAPNGCKTDWVMNEYRLPDNSSLPKDMVLCKIYRKATSMKVLEQRAAAEEAMKTLQGSSSSSPSSPVETVSFGSLNEESMMPTNKLQRKKEVEDLGPIEEPDAESEREFKKRKLNNSLRLPGENEELPELQLPRYQLDWTQDSFWTQFSPWFQSLTASPSILNL